MKEGHIPGKLLLFGEYTILAGGQALALPLPNFSGHWAKGQTAKPFDLRPFLDYLDRLQQEEQLLTPLRLDQFRQDLAAGLFFRSTIPAGYGAGSSGALCAAVYQRYAAPAQPPTGASSLPRLQKQLAQLESFFHGQSSGADPLVCYLKQPLLITSSGLETVQPVPSGRDAGRWYLIDTQVPRQTAPLVERFKARYRQTAFQQEVNGRLLPLSEMAIRAFLQGDAKSLEKAMRSLSKAQLNLLAEFIPEAFRAGWEAGLEAGTYFMKLCGAGGGGFLLGYAPAEKHPRIQSLKARIIPLAGSLFL